MNKSRTYTRCLTLALFCLALSTLPARADIVTLTLSNPVESGGAGQTLDFNATVSAPTTNAATVYLNGDSFNGTFPFSVDDSSFYNTFPTSLTPGQSFTGLLFDVALPANAMRGTYTGTFVLEGGPDANTYSILSTAGFTVNVTPEPSTILLLTLGLLGAFAVARIFRMAFGS